MRPMPNEQPPAAPPPPKATRSRYLTAAEAAAELGCCVRTFRRRFQPLFTDVRPPAVRGKGSPFKVRRDEFELAHAEGWEALANFRTMMGLIRRGRR